MAVAPKNLILGGKTHPDAPAWYRDDARRVEQWCNNLKVGSGGGRASGLTTILSGPESGADNTDNNGGIWFNGDALSVTLTPTSETDLGFSVHFGFAWVISTSAGNAVVEMPAIQMPTFTGAASLNVQLEMGAVSADNTQQARWVVPGGLNLTSGESYQTLDTDWFNEYNNGGDITLVAGSGNGSGLVTTAGGLLYFGSVVGSVSFNGVTFT